MTTKKKNGSRLPLDVLKIVLGFAIRDKYDFKILSRVSKSWKRLADEIAKTKRRKVTIPEYIIQMLQRRECAKVVIYEGIFNSITLTSPLLSSISAMPVVWESNLKYVPYAKGEWPSGGWGKMYGTWNNLQISLQCIIDKGLLLDEQPKFIIQYDTPKKRTTYYWDVPSLQKQLDDPEFQNKLFFL